MKFIILVVALIAAGWALWAYQRKVRRAQLMERYGDAPLVDKIMDKMIWQGMTEDQLIDSWGTPVAKDQRVYKTKIAETYKYNQTGRNRFESRVRVENGIVVGWEKK